MFAEEGEEEEDDVLEIVQLQKSKWKGDETETVSISFIQLIANHELLPFGILFIVTRSCSPRM